MPRTAKKVAPVEGEQAPDETTIETQEVVAVTPVMAESLVGVKPAKITLTLADGRTVELPAEVVKEWQVVWSDGTGYIAHVQTRFVVDTTPK